MAQKTRSAVYDDTLHIEAYRFDGIIQSFPNHFHEYYVLGLMEEGNRRLTCRQEEYVLHKGDIVLLNPGDNHICVQEGTQKLVYRGFNISQEMMLDLSREITGISQLPVFSRHVARDGEIAHYMETLHDMVMTRICEFGKDEQLLFLLSQVLQKYSCPFTVCIPVCQDEIEKTCVFIEQHFAAPLSLTEICDYAGLSKSTLLRAFTREKGITPYGYLLNVHINKAKKLLEKGVGPMEAALQTGFSDQSHFTNCFSRFMGLSPRMYHDIFLEKYKK